MYALLPRRASFGATGALLILIYGRRDRAPLPWRGFVGVNMSLFSFASVLGRVAPGALLMALLLLAASPVQAATYVVNSTDDVDDNIGIPIPLMLIFPLSLSDDIYRISSLA